MPYNSAAILLGALAIAAALAFSPRWEIITGGQSVLRLDRWTGAIALCLPRRDQRMIEATAAGTGNPFDKILEAPIKVKYDCEAAIQ